MVALCAGMRGLRGVTLALVVLGVCCSVSRPGFGLPVMQGMMRDDLVIDADGDGRADPGDTLRYRVNILNASESAFEGVQFHDILDPNTTLVPGSIRVSPLAIDDHYEAVGHIPLIVPAAEGLLANDVDPNDPSLDGVKVTGYDGKTSAGGIVVVDAAGGFTYVPPVGFRGMDSYGYTITDADGFTDSARVTIAIEALVWFVDNTALPGGSGTVTEPFDTLADVELVAATDDVVYIFAGDGTSTGLDTGVVLEAGQRLIGQGVDLVIGGQTLIQAATAPVLSATWGAAIALGSGAEVSGLVIDSAEGTGILGDSLVGPVLISSVTIANHIGDGIRLQNSVDGHFVLEDVSITTSSGGGLIAGDIGSVTLTASTVSAAKGAAIDITNAGMSIGLEEVYSVNSPGYGISLDNVRGIFIVSTDTNIVAPAFAGIRVRNSPNAVFALGHTGVTGAADGGVNMTNNPGSAFIFYSLDIEANGGTGLHVQNSGTIHIMGEGNSVTALNGTGIYISDTAIGPGGLTFREVSANGGPNGILLSNTGSGHFAVTGDGANPGSGGTIQNTTGDGIRLGNMQGVSLAYMNILNASGSGIWGTSVGDFSIAHSQLMDIGDADGEFGIGFDNLWGTNSIASTSMTNVADTNVFVENRTGVLDVLTVSNATFTGGAGSTYSGSGVFVRACETATIRSVSVADMTFRDMDGAGIDARAGLNSGSPGGVLENFVVERCAMENAQAGGVFFVTEGSGEGTFNLRDCPLVEARNAAALFVGANHFSQTTATVAGNVFSVTRTLDFGFNGVRILSDGEADSATTEVTFHENNVSGSDAEGIYAQSREGSGRLDIRITKNTVSSDGAEGIFVRSGSGSTEETAAVCLEISGNNSVGAEFYRGIWLYQEGAGTQFLLKDYTGGPTDWGALSAFIMENNIPSTGYGWGDVGFGSGDCTTPSP